MSTNIALRTLINQAVTADAAKRKLSDAVKAEIAKGFAQFKTPSARQDWLFCSVAEHLAAAYAKKTGEHVEAYVTRAGSISFKGQEGRSNASQAANMLFRYWVTQTTRQSAPKADPVARLTKLFNALNPAEQRRFLTAVK